LALFAFADTAGAALTLETAGQASAAADGRSFTIRGKAESTLRATLIAPAAGRCAAAGRQITLPPASFVVLTVQPAAAPEVRAGADARSAGVGGCAVIFDGEKMVIERKK
jgi:hypothetical protein